MARKKLRPQNPGDFISEVNARKARRGKKLPTSKELRLAIMGLV